MPTYVIMIRDRSRDAEQLAEYNKLAPETFKDHPTQFLVFHGTPEVLEGADAEDVMLAVFPTMDEAKAWYHSNSYIKARKHRHLGGDFRCIFVESSPKP